MKKRMFITTIVMMLVLAVALTTSSLAWFSASNASVTASAATFKAQTAGSNVNLKIAKSTGSWGNSVELKSGNVAVGSFEPVIPTDAIISKYNAGEYVWNPGIQLNGAKVGSDQKFIIDSTNPVQNYTVSREASNGYYYDYFYIHNADAQTAINALSFTVESSARAEESGETACKAFAALILYKAEYVAVDSTVPENAVENAGFTVVSKDASDPIGASSIKANTDLGTTELPDERYLAWIPFCAFTIGDRPTSGISAWQYADLDGSIDYNNVSILGDTTHPIETQEVDAYFGEAYNLNYLALQRLNSKGNDSNKDESSTFSMSAKETYRVDFYYWFDGLDLDEYKDTTKAEVSIKIEASNSNS